MDRGSQIRNVASTSTRNEVLDAAGHTSLLHNVKYLRLKVVYEAGVYVRMNASYDEATNIVIGSLDVGEFAETCSDMPSVVVVSPDGVHVT